MTADSNRPALAPGLYFVSTPIGNARDITLRALDTLAGVDLIAAEDTRTARKLMEIHGIALNGRPVLPYHDYNGDEMRPKLLAVLGEDRTLAYVSDAGTPMVADPGFALARAAIEAGHAVFSVPGASAALAALTVSGLPTDRFFFAGFAPQAAGKLRTFLSDLAQVEATLVVYEAPRRLKRFLDVSVDILGPGRNAAICRELTKKFEENRNGTLAGLAEFYASAKVKGEIVVLIGRAERMDVREIDIESALRSALKDMSVKDAAAFVAETLDVPKRQIYQRALSMTRD